MRMERRVFQARGVIAVAHAAPDACATDAQTHLIIEAILEAGTTAPLAPVLSEIESLGRVTSDEAAVAEVDDRGHQETSASSTRRAVKSTGISAPETALL